MDLAAWQQMIAGEIESLQQRLRPRGDISGRYEETMAHWTLTADSLRWHVQVIDCLEPDIDLEFISDGILVRAKHCEDASRIFCSVLAIPGCFDLEQVEIHSEAGYLEVRIRRRMDR